MNPPSGRLCNRAPDPAFGAAVFARVPLPFALDLDAGAVDQQVQRTLRPAIGDVDLQGLLPPAQGAEVRHRPGLRPGPLGCTASPVELGPLHIDLSIAGLFDRPCHGGAFSY
jgi:hypothetical protein